MAEVGPNEPLRATVAFLERYGVKLFPGITIYQFNSLPVMQASEHNFSPEGLVALRSEATLTYSNNMGEFLEVPLYLDPERQHIKAKVYLLPTGGDDDPAA